MEPRRSFPWPWIIATVLLVVLVGAVAYVVGLNAGGAGQPVGFVRPFRPFAGMHGLFSTGVIGFWLLVLLLAIVVGVLVAAIARPSQRTETFEEWHRREHQAPPNQPTAEPPTSSAAAPDTSDEARPSG